MPKRRKVPEPVYDLASTAIIFGLVLLAFATFKDYGITWDETWHKKYGQYIVDWYLTGFEDRSALSYRGDYLYGGAFDGLGAIAVRLLPLPWWQSLHLFGAMIGILGVLGTWKLARTLGGAAAGFWATVMLATTSVYYGHMFNNPKDIPFAAGYVFACVYLVKVAQVFPRVPRHLWIKLSIACGAAMSVRIGGLLTLCYLLALIVGYGVWASWQTGNRRFVLRVLRRFLPRFLGVMAGAWIVMLVFWPWALLDPIRRPFFALARMTRFLLHVRRMPFGDGEIWTYNVPPDYLIRYFGLKLPEPVLLLGVVGGASALYFAVKKLRNPDAFPQLAVTGVLGLAVVFPPLYAIVVRSSLYDGLRHFLFLVPLLCAVAGAVMVRVMDHLDRNSDIPSATIPVVVVLLCAQQARQMIHLHPHEYVYFNRLAGGLPGVYKRYDTDYYGNGYKEAFELVRHRLWEEDPEAFLNHRHRLDGCIPDFIARNYIDAPFFWKEKEDKNRASFFLGYQRANCHERHQHRPIFATMEREDTPLIIIRDLRNPNRDRLERKARERKRREQAQKRAQERARERARKAATDGGEPAPERKSSPEDTK